MNFTFISKPFSQLTPFEVYDILHLRNEVFVVEQNCVFQDADNKDQDCHHLMLYQEAKLIAYARLVPPGLAFPEMSIGRIITSPAVRGTGTGKKLMQEAIAQSYTLFGPGPIRIGAQLYAIGFYELFGFEAAGPIYDEDGIDHIEMVKPA